MGTVASTIINDVAVECGLTSVANPYTSTDQNFILLRTLLNSAGTEMHRSRDWAQFIVEGTVTGNGALVEFAPPADFARFIPQTGWNRTTDIPLSDPMRADEWQAIKATAASVAITVLWRFRGGKIWFNTAPANANDVKYEYLSKYWAGTVDSAGIGTQEFPTAATDYVMLDRFAITRLLKAKWLQSKGLDDRSTLREYRDAYANACAVEPARVLYITPPGDSIVHFNVPDTGYGA